MKRRKTLKLMGVAGVGASVSGCSGILGGCGPGDDEIGALAEDVDGTETTAASTATTDAKSASITGKIQSIGDTEVVVDDGTGRAELTTLFGGFTSQNVDEGDCVQASGLPFAPEEGSDNDIRLLVEEVGLADE